MLSLSETSINMKTKEARMEFRRQRNYPEVVNVTFEDHPTVCIWIHALAVVVALDLNMGLKAFYSSFDCMKKPTATEEEVRPQFKDSLENLQKFQKPPSYSVCVTSASQSTLPPSYDEAIQALQNQPQLVPSRKSRSSGIFVVWKESCIIVSHYFNKFLDKVQVGSNNFPYISDNYFYPPMTRLPWCYF